MKCLWLPILVALLLPPALSRAGDDLQAGIAAYAAGDFQTARRLLAPLAEGGNAEAQFVLGKAYYFGKGDEQDYATAIGRFTDAARQGHASAAGFLGYMAELGIGTPKDSQKALCLYIDAARRGHADSQWNLAMLYLNLRSMERHRYWLDRAVRQGQEDALEWLAGVWLLNPLEFDKTKAYLYLMVAARKGHKAAAERLRQIRKSPSFVAVEQLAKAERDLAHWTEEVDVPPAKLTPISDDCYPPAR